MKKQLSIKQVSKKVYLSSKSRILSWNLKKLTKVFVVFAVLIGLSGLYVWFNRLYMTDERRFWIAIENSMATGSVTRTLESGGTGNKVTQTQQFFFSPQQATRSHVTFTQKNATVDTSVETEGISFVGEQYSRYTTFSTNQRKQDGSVPTLDSILGKWEGSKSDPAELEQAKLTYVGDLVTLAIFGNFDADFRKTTVNELRNSNAYDINKAAIKTEIVDGKKAVLVPVSIKLKKYVAELNNSFVKAGYGSFPPLNPDNYTEDSQISALFLIEPRNNSIIGIQYSQREERFSGYGINIAVVAPKTEFSNGELESIVQEEIQTAL